jgi:hypothetical protein
MANSTLPTRRNRLELPLPPDLACGEELFQEVDYEKEYIMKKLTARIIVALAVCALTFSTAMAGVKSKTVTFGVDFVVGETVVKKGTYKLKFDDRTNELLIVGKDNTVMAKTTARLEKRERAAVGNEIVLAQKGSNQALISIAFTGDNQNIVINARGMETAQARN